MWALFASRAWNFLKAIPDWIWWVIVAVVFGKFIDMRARADQSAKDKAREKLARANTQVAIITAQKQVVQQESALANQAIQARDSVASAPASDELSDQEYLIAFGRPKSHR
jgi:hypothetical protein